MSAGMLAGFLGCMGALVFLGWYAVRARDGADKFGLGSFAVFAFTGAVFCAARLLGAHL